MLEKLCYEDPNGLANVLIRTVYHEVLHRMCVSYSRQCGAECNDPTEIKAESPAYYHNFATRNGVRSADLDEACSKWWASSGMLKESMDFTDPKNQEYDRIMKKCVERTMTPKEMITFYLMYESYHHPPPDDAEY